VLPATALLAPALLAPALLALALLPGLLRPVAAAENPAPADAKAPRPPDLVILQEWLTREGPQSIGVYGVKVDPLRSDNRLIVRELNPGGPITKTNRLDHLIWWAVCVPAQTGKDPATLAALARSLGYSGQLIEREEVLVAPRR
jgi:hypothetical protein